MSDQRIIGGGKTRKARGEGISPGARRLARQSRGVRTTADAIGFTFDTLGAMFEQSITGKEASTAVKGVTAVARLKEKEYVHAMLEGMPVAPVVLRPEAQALEEKTSTLTDEERQTLALLLKKASASAETMNGDGNGEPVS